MWKQIIAPALVVAGFWLVVTPVTTYFIYWLDQSYQYTLTRNLVSIQAAGDIREYIWRILSVDNSMFEREWPNDSPEMRNSIEQAVQQLKVAATSPEEQPIVARIESQWNEFKSQMESDGSNRRSMRRFHQLNDSAKAITTTANEIREINKASWLAAEQRRGHWKGIILTVRVVVVIVGPGVGIALGWWLSKRLHRSISQINIILKDASVDWEESLAKLKLSGREDLSDVRERVEKVVERLRQVNAELDAARHETLRAERLAAVGALAAGVAHELRNPLTSVKLLLQHAAQQPGDTRLGDDETCIIIDEVLRMENTIQGLLDFSRPPSPQRKRHDVRLTLQRALNLVQGRAKQHRVQIETTLPSEPIFVDCDAEQLHQVFVNLLINAIDADPGGVLEIDANRVASDKVHRIRFRDFGPGIPDDILVHLFEPFVSAKERGTGLGLAVSRRIVLQHQGSLTGENHPDGGAIFTVELPAAKDEPLTAEANVTLPTESQEPSTLRRSSLSDVQTVGD
jgi:two-component system sensor histidine kinase HydH